MPNQDSQHRSSILRSSSEQGDDALDALDGRLMEFGFLFNPFRHLEASNDPHLFEYVLTDSLPQSAWLSGGSILFSPRGGGKTALRMYVTREFWSRFDRHPFPVHLLPQARDLADPSPDGVWRPLVCGLSRALMLAICHRPLSFAELTDSDWVRLLRLIAPHLPRKIAHYLAVVATTGQADDLRQSLGDLRQLLDRSYVIPIVPDLLTVAEVRHTIVRILSRISGDERRVTDLRQTFLELAAILAQPLHFGELFVLIDGADAYSTAVAPLEMVASWLSRVIILTGDTIEVPINLKGFIPHLLEPFLRPYKHSLERRVKLESLEWTRPELVKVLRSRVKVATGGRFDSLDALSDPGLIGIEEEIAQIVQPLPREAIYLASELLRSHFARHSAPTSQFDIQDMNDVIKPYHSFERIPLQW